MRKKGKALRGVNRHVDATLLVRRGLFMCLFGAALGLFGPTSTASAEEPVTLRRGSANTLPPPVFAPSRGTELSLARELEWSRLSLAGDTGSVGTGSSDGFGLDTSPAALPFTDLRSSLWLSSPEAMSSIASAAASLITGGISVFDVRRGNRICQRHSLRGYFKARGMAISWRVRF